MLEHPHEAGVLVTDAAARFAMKNSRKRRRDGLVFQDDAARNEVEAFCGLIGSQSNQNLSVRITDDEINGD
jgi:hypothetical protein